MGNDGGTIAKRKDLLSLYDKEDQVPIKGDDLEGSLLVTCAISSLPLYNKTKQSAPVVGDYKGNLYLKEKVIEYLIQRKSSGEEPDKSSRWNHVRSTKDLIDVSITWHTDSQDSGVIECPVTGETRLHSYSYLRPCGCVISYKVLQEMGRDLKASNQNPVQSNCPSCNVEFYFNYDIVILNPLNVESTAKFNLENYRHVKLMGLTHSKKRKSKGSLKGSLKLAKKQKINTSEQNDATSNE